MRRGHFGRRWRVRENNIKMCLKEIVCEAVDLIRVFQVEANGGFFFCRYCNEPLGCIKGRKFCNSMGNY